MDTRYYQTGGFTIELNSDRPFNADTFSPEINQFEMHVPGNDKIIIHHFFNREINLDVNKKDIIYYNFPWTVYQKKNKIIYEFNHNHSTIAPTYKRIVTNKEHTKFEIYNDTETAKLFSQGKNNSLTLFSSDQILLSRILAYRQGCIFHSSGIVTNNKGLIFIGHSTAGKSTIAKIMAKNATILCDERNIIRKQSGTYQLYGTWHHSILKKVSPISAPLNAIFFLNKSNKNKIEYIENTTDRFNLLIGRIIKPLATKDWWNATIDIIYDLSKHVKCYNLYFDKSGKISTLIEKM